MGGEFCVEIKNSTMPNFLARGYREFFKAGRGIYVNVSMKLALYINNSNFINLGFVLKRVI